MAPHPQRLSVVRPPGTSWELCASIDTFLDELRDSPPDPEVEQVLLGHVHGNTPFINRALVPLIEDMRTYGRRWLLDRARREREPVAA